MHLHSHGEEHPDHHDDETDEHQVQIALQLEENREAYHKFLASEDKPARKFTPNKMKVGRGRVMAPPRIVTEKKFLCRPGGVVKSAMNWMMESLTDKCVMNSTYLTVSATITVLSLTIL